MIIILLLRGLILIFWNSFYRPQSDAKVSLLEFVELENYLSDLLGVKVDLIEKSALKPGIARHILAEVEFF